MPFDKSDQVIEAAYWPWCCASGGFFYDLPQTVFSYLTIAFCQPTAVLRYPFTIHRLPEIYALVSEYGILKPRLARADDRIEIIDQ
ncbi:MAG: hypothetical protein ABJQ71_01300 [Roseibium sp.]|uniref:hypothetical protein n=1 Tax=Roseibium polysiphoniae TaxID=2571221 RepID=UPI0032987F6A